MNAVSQGRLVRMAVSCVFPHLLGISEEEWVGLHTGGIISPICPEISSFSLWNLPGWDWDICCSISTWLSVLQPWSFWFFCLFFVSCAHKTHHDGVLLHFQNNALLQTTQGMWNICLPVYPWLFCVLAGCCVFTFVVFNIHCCLGLQQQRDQLFVTTQGSVVQRRQPSNRHEIMCKNTHIHICSVKPEHKFAVIIFSVEQLRPSALCERQEGANDLLPLISDLRTPEPGIHTHSASVHVRVCLMDPWWI